MDIEFHVELLLLLTAATAGVVLFERLRLPAIAGFLVVGALVGPGGLGLIADAERVRALAEIGVVFLLFEIGLELPVDRLRRLWRPALAAGGLQVALTVCCVAGIAAGLGVELRSATVLGALVAMSSTALVIRVLSERGEIDAPHGQLAVGILLFQDLCVVPFLLAIPILAAGADAQPSEIAWVVGRSVVALALFAGIARFVLPSVLDRVARLRSREVFTMVALLAVLGSAVLAEALGLTLSVGAFIGGLVLSASPYAQQLFAEVIPLRGILLGMFFTAVGMLFEPATALLQWPGVLAYVGGVVVIKAGFIAAIIALALRQGWRLGILTGLALAQTGEFSVVLAGVAAAAGLLDSSLHQIFLAGTVVTLVATPFWVAAAPRIASRLALSGVPGTEPIAEGASDHVALVGFGLAGQNVARVLKARGIRYEVVEANANAVRAARARGEPITYGDATRRAILERVGVHRARLVVVAISDPIATLEVVSLARGLAPEAVIIARTRYVLEVDRLEQAGATNVVAEEFESTLELVGSVLQRFGVPDASIARFTEELRDEGYVFLRNPDTILDPWLTEILEDVASQWVEVPDHFVGSVSLAALEVRRRTGASVVSVQSGDETTISPGADFSLRAGDRLLTVGEPDSIDRLRNLIDAWHEETP